MARAAYIGNSNEILNMFEFATPAQVLSAVQTYSCALYGSVLWDLYGTAASKLYRSWNSTCKIAYELPPQCHTYIVDHYLSGPLPSLRQLLIKRYVQFVQKLFSGDNPVIQQVAALAVCTVRSVTGLNVKNISEEFKKDPLLDNKHEFTVSLKEVPENGQETIEQLVNLLDIRSQEVDKDIISELDSLILDVCSK